MCESDSDQPGETEAEWLTRIHPEDGEKAGRELSDALLERTHENASGPCETLPGDGASNRIVARGEAEPSLGGEAPGALTVTQSGVTAQRQAEAALRESERRFRQVTESLPQLIWTCNANGLCDYLSPQWIEYTGKPAVEQLGYGWLEQLYPADRERTVASWQATASRGDSFAIEFRIRRRDGVFRWFRTLAVPLRGADGAIVKWFGSNTDIQDIKETEEALRASESRFRATFESAAVGMAHVAPDGALLRVNRRLCEIVGYPAEELQTKKFQDITHPDDLDSDLVQVRRILSGEIESYGLEKRYLRKDGAAVWIHLTVGCVRDADSRVEYFIVAVQDISARKHAEEELRQSEARYRTLHESLRDAFVQVSMDGRIIEYNALYRQMLGYAPGELRALKYQELTPERWHAFEDAIVRDQILPRGYSDVYEKEYRRKDGTIIPVELRTVLARDETGRPSAMWAIVRDITERKQHEQHLHVVMRELAHRSKNLLAVVQAMVRQTAHHAEDIEAFISQLDSRIGALSHAHDLLIEQNWRGAALLDLVAGQLQPFVDLSSGRVRIEGRPLLIGPQATQHMALALHELATNSCKYGALSRPGGVVSIVWRAGRGEAGGNSFSFTWAENGGPAVQEPSRRGFGTLVLERLVASGLNGRARLDYPADGLTWTLSSDRASFCEEPSA
jgi:PAS domain S-box-containing protein